MNFHPDTQFLFEDLFERALTLELVEDGDEITLEDLQQLLTDFSEGW